jgi:tartrate dehydratase alpha subunit/fumarate hydratase class I-like protein
MNLQEHIKKVLREETGERTKLEKVITNVINRALYGKELPENFHSVVVDVYGTFYGDGCKITLLMKGPYSEEESNMLFDISKDAKNLINSFFKEHFLYGISISTSTIENYMKMKSD